MNRYSKVFHYISVEDVKRNCHKKYQKNKNFLESIVNARKFLKDLNSPYYSDWRSNKLKEGMNTGNVFVTTFPSTGDSNLENIDANSADAYTAAGGLDALNGTSIRSNGSGSGSEGGFNVGQSYLGFDGEVDSRHAILDPIDSSKFDTMSIRAIVGNDSNGGEDPDVPGEELRLYYLEPNGSSFKSISINPAGDQVLSADSDVIIALGDGLDGALQNFSISLPSYARGEGFTYMLYQLSNSGGSFDHYGITNIKYQRRSPVTLVVSLDSPEAVSFMRDGGNLTPAEKKKRLEDMLAASDEYVEKMFPTNQEAMRRAEQNLQRNIDISLDPDTFKFPEYGTPQYNQMYNPRLEADSDINQIKNSLESKGLTLDTLKKDFSPNGSFRSLGREGTLILLNNPETQEKAFNAMGIDLNLIKNLTDDTYRKLSEKTYFTPGGTPSTGWDGKMYEYDSPELEKSRIVPLETYLEATKRDGYYGVERPDVAPAGRRYVMEKKYGFQSDDKATPNLTGPQNETTKQQSENAKYNIYRIGSYGTLGYTWDLVHFERGLGGDLEPGSNFARGQVIDSITVVLNHMYNSRDSFAYAYANEYGADTTAEYDPLYFLLKDDRGQRALEIASSSSASQLYYPLSDFGGSDPEYLKKVNDQKQDRRIADFKKAYDRIKSMSTDFVSYDNDEWYVKNKGATGGQSYVTVGAPTKAHPYSGLTEPEPTLTPEEPTPEEPTPEEPEKDLTDISKSVSKDVKSDDEIVDELGKVSEYYKDKKIKNPEIQTPNLLKSLVNFFTGADDSLLADVLPAAYEYGADIAASVLTGKPINLTKNNVSTRDLELMFNQLSPNEVGVFSKPEAYADDNIRELPNGNVVVNTTGRNNTRAIYKPPTATLPGGQQVATDFGYSNPIGAAGQAQVQLVVPSSNPRDAYFRYNDHAYYNDQSSDRGELPLGDFDPRRIPGALVNGISRAVYPNGLQGYPPNIRGDRTLKFDVSYDELPQNFKDKVNTEIDFRSIGGGSLGDTLQDTDATDAATVAADNKRKKKPTVAAEMYEPKAKHNEKITKHPKMKSPKEFFKRADIKPVYPDTPPPEMINGRHPDWQDDTKLAKRFSKLDPQSARAMPDTGSPQVDALIRAARKKPK